MKNLLTIPLLFLCSLAMGQTVKPKHTYKIAYADTVNIYNDKTVICIKQLNGDLKYIVVRKNDRYTLKRANVVNMYAKNQTVNIDTLEVK